MAETTLQASVPSIPDLCCVIAEIDLTEVQDSSAKSHFHWKTLKCRLMLDTMRDTVIACPLYQTLSSIHVVTSVEFFNSQVFQKNLREMNVAWSSPRPVTPDVYANCLRYSILFAIAPRWNKIGQYLIAGKYFLMDIERSIATKFKLSLDTTNETNIIAMMKIQPVRIKQNYLSLNDIDIPHEVAIHFLADPRGTLDITHYGNYRITVLPSLKKGKLMMAHKNIPASSPFKNYGELRRHWKNMYGYRLPLSDAGIIYYDVYFTNPSAHRFLYPHICVRSRFEEMFYSENRESPIRNFLRDANEAIATICGRAFVMVEKNLDHMDNSIMIKTPEGPSRKREICQNFDDTTRLSFSARYAPINQQQQQHQHQQHQHQHQQPRRTDISPLMSPTPSLRGHFPKKEESTDKSRINIVRNFSTSRLSDAKSATRIFPRSKDDKNRLESQNRCPNSHEEERREKITKKDHSTLILEKYREQRLLSSRLRNDKPKIENNEISSRYFDSREGGFSGGTNRTTLDNREISENRNNVTLLQKLRRNIVPKNETMNDCFEQMK